MKDTQKMKITHIDVDKRVAAPYDGSNDLYPTDPDKYYTISIQVYDENGNPIPEKCDVYLKDNQNLGRIRYWDMDLNEVTDTIDDRDPVPTDDHGFLQLIVAVDNYGSTTYAGCIFELYASPTENAMTYSVSRTLVCCYSDYDDALNVANQKLAPLVPNNGEDPMVTIPPWNEFRYNGLTRLTSLSNDVAPSAKLAIIINGQVVDRAYSYKDLTDPVGVIIPYGMLKPSKDISETNNCILYIVDEGNKAKASLPWQFAVEGTPLCMPDPEKQTRYAAPWWFGAAQGEIPSPQPLTLDSLHVRHQKTKGFAVSVKVDSNAKPGDLYRIFIYLNGYRAADKSPHTQLLGDGSKLDGSTWPNVLEFTVDTDQQAAGSVVTMIAPEAACYDFNKRDLSTPGYCWIDYQVNGAEWSAVYTDAKSPILIDFAESSFEKNAGEDSAKKSAE